MKRKRKHSLYANIILLIGSLLIGMILMEIVLRFIFPNGYFQYKPIPGVHTTYEYTYHIKTNSWGIRDREFSKQELECKKILLLGDSMTYGQGVEVEDTFPKIIEKRLSKINPNLLVINGGGKGTSTVGQFESLKELMDKHFFYAIGFCFFLGNDADNNYEDINKAEKARRIFERKGRIYPIKEWLFGNSILYNYVYYKLKLMAYKMRLIPSFVGQNQLKKEYTERGKKGWDITFSIIDEIKQYFDRNKKTRLFFVLLPQDFQVDPEKQRNYGLTQDEYDFLKPNRLLKTFLLKNSISYLDTTQAFINHYQIKSYKKLFFPIDRHFNKSGHKLVANLLSSFLISEGLVSDIRQSNKGKKRYEYLTRVEINK